MPLRYSDFDLAASGAKDFVIRKRAPSIPQLAVIFAAVVGIAISVTMSPLDKVAIITILFFLLGTVGCYVLMQFQRTRDLVLVTEFQNALFASALGMNNRFCLIIRRDGNIVYMDRAFQSMFSDFVREPHRLIDNLFAHGKVAHEDKEKIFNVIERGIFDKVIFDIRASDNQTYKIVMSIEPILRPSGFILLRGREFVEQRSDKGTAAAPLKPPPMNKSNVTLFSSLLDTMDMGVYITNPSGLIIYVNTLLEQWLGFRDGEITSGTVSLQNIMLQDGREADQAQNFEGTATLQKKGGGILQALINQKIIYDDNGNTIGCTGMVHNIAMPVMDSKKKLW